MSRKSPLRRILGAAALVGGIAVAGHAMAQGAVRAEPYPAWPDPVIQPTLSVDQAKAIVADRTQPQTAWTGPTAGPEAPKGSFTIAYVSPDQSYTPYVQWGKGIEEAAQALGWKMMTFNGQGTVSGTLAAIQQARAANPAAIITPADANALQKPIQDAVAHHIPVIGIHATAFPGPSPQLGLYMNIVSNPAEIGQTEAAYVIAMSNGMAHDGDADPELCRMQDAGNGQYAAGRCLDAHDPGHFRPAGALWHQLVDDDLLRRLLHQCRRRPPCLRGFPR
jgi:ribose transport system substrate-binding protein